ncbi:Protein of unknown function [Gryllus bimaculatus]|nr:Protein of unknown function [Gryllus bimaculatus]
MRPMWGRVARRHGADASSRGERRGECARLPIAAERRGAALYRGEVASIGRFLITALAASRAPHRRRRSPRPTDLRSASTTAALGRGAPIHIALLFHCRNANPFQGAGRGLL